MATTVKKAVKKEKTAKEIQVVADNNYHLLAIKDIEFAPRPEQGQEKTLVFFNPRPEDEVLNPEKLAKLEYSIRCDGLMEPPCVRVWTENKKVVRAQLIAGERRMRVLNHIHDLKLPCVDEEGKKPSVFQKDVVVNWKNRFGTVISQNDSTVKIQFDDEQGKGEQDCEYADVTPTVTGDKRYKQVPVKIYYDISDERAMRISFSENDNSEPLSVKAEIDLVERYVAMDFKQAQIASMLNTNITFVSQRSSFRTQLPQGAFEKLMVGQMAAHIAVNMLAYAQEDRQKYFDHMVEEEKVATTAKVQKHETEQYEHEDEAESHKAAAKKAAVKGDDTTAAKEEKKAASAEAKATKSKQRKEKAASDSGTIKQSHAQRAAIKAQITPKKAKVLSKEQIELLYVKGMTKYVSGGQIDPICQQEIPSELASIVRRAALAIINGQIDPLTVIRDYMVENDKWALSASTSAAKIPQHVLNDDEEDEEESSEEDEESEDEGSELEESEEGITPPAKLFDEEFGFDDDEPDDAELEEINSRYFGSGYDD